MGRGRGFTLIELLVVVAIVGILAALLLAGISNVKDRANTVKCAANLKQIGAALFSYAADNNGQLIAGYEPAPNTLWYNALEPYMGGGDLDVNSTNRPKWQECPSKQFKTFDRFSVGYGWNYTFFGTSWADSDYTKWYYGYGARLSSIDKPSKVVIIGDSMDLTNVTASYQNIYVYYAYDLFARRHSGKGNYLFVDGHTEALTPDALRANDSLRRSW
ncbi:hypothetical protein BH09VER1_BH09VER1_07710 [soil metagenome]